MAKEPSEVTVWEPFGMMTPLREAMNRLLEDSFISPARFEPLLGKMLLLDVYETDSEYTIEASLPGVKPEDLKVSAPDRRHRSLSWSASWSAPRGARGTGHRGLACGVLSKAVGLVSRAW